MKTLFKIFPTLSVILSILSFEVYSSAYALDNINNIYDVQIDLTNFDVSVNIDFPDDQMDTMLTKSILYQFGEENRAEIFQASFMNTALIYQSGFQNIAYITQEVPNNLAFIYQEGMMNDAIQIQKGNNNRAIAIQIGERNVAKQEQFTSDNLAIIYQIGLGNYAEQIQGYGGGGGYKSYIIQRGSYNYIKVVQY